jgi:hypothetical protein
MSADDESLPMSRSSDRSMMAGRPAAMAGNWMVRKLSAMVPLTAPEWVPPTLRL